jgi:hypothetical protein
MASREVRATPALKLPKEDPAFEAGIGSVIAPELSPRVLPGVVLFRGTVGVSVGVSTVGDGVTVGGTGEMVCM